MNQRKKDNNEFNGIHIVSDDHYIPPVKTSRLTTFTSWLGYSIGKSMFTDDDDDYKKPSWLTKTSETLMVIMGVLAVIFVVWVFVVFQRPDVWTPIPKKIITHDHEAVVVMTQEEIHKHRVEQMKKQFAAESDKNSNIINTYETLFELVINSKKCVKLDDWKHEFDWILKGYESLLTDTIKTHNINPICMSMFSSIPASLGTHVPCLCALMVNASFIIHMYEPEETILDKKKETATIVETSKVITSWKNISVVIPTSYTVTYTDTDNKKQIYTATGPTVLYLQRLMLFIGYDNLYFQRRTRDLLEKF